MNPPRLLAVVGKSSSALALAPVFQNLGHSALPENMPLTSHSPNSTDANLFPGPQLGTSNAAGSFRYLAGPEASWIAG